MTPQSMQDSLFLEFIRSIPCHSNQAPFVLVIDALDECGNIQSRADILKVLIVRICHGQGRIEHRALASGGRSPETGRGIM